MKIEVQPLIKNPCRSICILDEDDNGKEYCIGCFRTALEIQHWGEYTPARRDEVIAELPQREEDKR